MNSPAAPKRGRAFSVLRRYFLQVRQYPLALTLLVLGSIGYQSAELMAPLYLKRFFNLLATAPTEAAVGALVATVLVYGAIQLASWSFLRLQTYSILYIEWNAMTELYRRSFEYLLGHSYNFFISNFAGSLTHKVSRYARAFEVVLDSLMLQFFPTTIFIGGAFTILFLRNHTLGLILGAWVICFLAFQVFMARLRQPVRTARAAADSANTAALADAIGNHTTIQLFAGAPFERERFTEIVKRWRAATIRSWTVDDVVWAGQGLLMVIINVTLLYSAVRFWKAGLLTVGDFVLIQSYLIGAFTRLLSINRELRRFYDVFADASEMVEILEMPHEVADVPGSVPLRVSRGEIAFTEVDFRFTPEASVLSDFGLRIAGGEKIALVGPSGAGKSTITKLLLRLFDINAGSIEIDGQNIARVTQDSLRAQIAFVPQEPILFHRTLMENIRYGRRDATDAEVIEASKKAHCHEFISRLPQKYETYVGERGIKLSGGERQRVAIARAILKNAPILLLDEATSSLDSESEALIQDALEVLMQGKTVLVIAHRLSTIMKMDRIVVLEKGAVVASGTHEELLAQGGLYHKLWSIQVGGFMVDEEEASAVEGELTATEENENDEELEKMPEAAPHAR